MERRVAMRALIAVHGHEPAGWADDERLTVLPKGVEATRVSASYADPVRTIADHAAEWRPDIVRSHWRRRVDAAGGA